MAVLQILTITLSVSADEVEEKSQQEAVILENGQIATESVTVPEDGEYEISIVFKAVEESTQMIEYAVRIDGEYPF